MAEQNNQAERAAFEEWMKARPGYPFAGAFANLMWDAWKAARRSTPAAETVEKDAERYQKVRAKVEQNRLTICRMSGDSFDAIVDDLFDLPAAIEAHNRAGKEQG